MARTAAPTDTERGQPTARRLTRMEKAMDEMAESQRLMAASQKEMSEGMHAIQVVVSRLQEADITHSDGLKSLAQHNTDALQTFKQMLEDQRNANVTAIKEQREASDKALAALTDTLTNKALEQIQANMVSALFRRVTDWLITLAVAGAMFGASWVYTHVKP